ncbi:hypothetical protein BY996DRAFT_6597642 [Phakopsora pachyrhizi]|nr:hypothetical protein BY996DRAFT_6597642 [Phakopsora pachyrhizi]
MWALLKLILRVIISKQPFPIIIIFSASACCSPTKTTQSQIEFNSNDQQERIKGRRRRAQDEIHGTGYHTPTLSGSTLRYSKTIVGKKRGVMGAGMRALGRKFVRRSRRESRLNLESSKQANQISVRTLTPIKPSNEKQPPTNTSAADLEITEVNREALNVSVNPKLSNFYINIDSSQDKLSQELPDLNLSINITIDLNSD